MNISPFHGGWFGFLMMSVFHCLLLSLPVIASADDYTHLQGPWQCEEEGAQATLDFQSQTSLLYNGEQSDYQLVPGIIRVPGEYGPEDYYYQFSDETLVIMMPNGSMMQCAKATKNVPQASPPAKTQTPAVAMPTLERPKGPATGDESDQASLLYKFAGKWSNYSPNTETHIYLKPDGTYSNSYDSSYGGQFYDQGGYQAGAWGAAGSNSGQGRWTVEGTLKQGQITLIDVQGNRTVYQYAVHVQNGQTYWGEYFFNGKLYGVTYIYR
jgi:hypothetical protein